MTVIQKRGWLQSGTALRKLGRIASQRIRRPCTLAIFVSALLLSSCGREPNIASAQQFLKEGSVDAAIVELKALLSENPNQAQGRYLLGNAHHVKSDYASALKEYSRARELGMADDIVIPSICRTLLDSGDNNKLLADFNNITLQKNDAIADYQTSLAAGYLRAGRQPESEKALGKALAAVPDYPRALLVRAMIAYVSGDMKSALATTRAVQATDPKRVEAYLFEGFILQHVMRQNADAVAAYKKALSIKTDLPIANTELFEIYLSEGKIDLASQQLNQVKQKYPKAVITSFLEAKLAVGKRDFKSAQEHASTVLRAVPDNPAALALSGLISMKTGAFTQAEATLEKASKLAPTNPLVKELLARLNVDAGKPTKAIQILDPTNQRERLGVNALLLVGQAYLQLGDFKSATAFLDQARRIDPGRTDIKIAMAMAKMSSGANDAGFSDLTALATENTDTVADLSLISALMSKDRFDDAIQAIARLQAKIPTKALPDELRGRALLGKKDFAAARESFERALAKEPSSNGGARALVALDVAQGRTAEAVKRLDSLLATHAEAAWIRTAKASILAQVKGQNDDVLRLLAEAKTLEPANPVASLMLIDHHIKLRNFRQALNEAELAEAAYPGNPDVLEALARSQSLSGDGQRALSTYKKLTAMSPNSDRAWMHFANAQLATRDSKGAIQSLKRASEVNPSSIAALQLLISTHIKSGDRDAAIRVARATQISRPREQTGFLLEGDIFATEKNWPGAITAYREAVKVEPSSSVAAQKLHAAYLKTQRDPEAARFAADWLRSNAKEIGFRLYLGAIALASNDLAAAEARYREIIALDGNEVVALNNLGLILAQQGKPEAVNFAERALAQSPNNPLVLDTLALALSESSSFDRAIATQRKAVALAPNAPELRLGLAKILMRAGNTELAAAELKTLAALGPKFARQSEVAELQKKTEKAM